MALAEYRSHDAPKETYPASFEYNNLPMQQMSKLDRNEPMNSYQHSDLPIHPRTEPDRFTQNRTYGDHNPIRSLQTPESTVYPVEQPYSNKADRYRECSTNSGSFNYSTSSKAYPSRSRTDKLRTQDTMQQLTDSREKYMNGLNNRLYWKDNSFMLMGERVPNNYVRTVLKKIPLEKGLHVKPIFVIYNPKDDPADSEPESDEDSAHSCDLCEKQYSLRTNLLRHMRNSHPE
jgi:hypothetical protein